MAAAAAGSNALLGLDKKFRRVLHAMPSFSACNEDAGRRGEARRRQLHKRVVLSFPVCMRRWRGREVVAFIMGRTEKNDEARVDDASLRSSRGNTWRFAPTQRPPSRPPHSSKNTMLEGCHLSTLRCTSPRAS